MVKLYVLLLVAVAAVVTGLLGFFWISWSPVTEPMADFGLFTRFVLPVLPSVVLALVGVHVVMRYRHQVPISARVYLAAIVTLYMLAVWVSFYFIYTGGEPVREAAFNWSFYLMPAYLLVYKVEQLLWLRYG